MTVAIVPAHGGPPLAAAIDAATSVLSEGLPVAIPTDTVYGLAVDPFLVGATDRLFEAKRRPRDVSVPLLVCDVEQALSVATCVPDAALAFMERFWPGPLTIVLPSRPGLGADLGDDDVTVGVRCPDHAVPSLLCQRIGPLATTSANLHGQAPAETAAEVTRLFGASITAVLDSGPCRGSPSTVIDCTGPAPRLLRPGRLGWDELCAALGGDGGPGAPAHR